MSMPYRAAHCPELETRLMLGSHCAILMGDTYLHTYNEDTDEECE
jgi:hypothetical protein